MTTLITFSNVRGENEFNLVLLLGQIILTPHFFGKTRLTIPYLGEMTLRSQICKIIYTLPPFSFFVYLLFIFLTNA
jgi:hypothetical protein